MAAPCHARRLQASPAFCSPAASGQRSAAALPRRQLARQALCSWQRQRAVAAAAAPRDFDKDRFEAANKDYAKLTQQIEVRCRLSLFSRRACWHSQMHTGEHGPAWLPRRKDSWHAKLMNRRDTEQALLFPPAACRTPRWRWWRGCRAPACSWWA